MLQSPSLYLLVLAAALVLLALYLLLRLKHSREEISRIRHDRASIVAEEEKFFEFLNGLGEAIYQDASSAKLHRLIVRGVSEVVDADGGAIYLYDQSDDLLVPSYYSSSCPPVVTVPERILQRVKQDGADQKDRGKIISSYLKLHPVSAQEGIIGRCYAGGRSLLVEELLREADFEVVDPAAHRNISVMLAPIAYGEKKFGVLLVARQEGVAFTDNDRAVFRSVAEQSSYALGNAVLHNESNKMRRMEQELHNASLIQKVLIPDCDPQWDGFALAASNVPARSVSGDYFDYINLDEDRYGVVIADVSGKGISAALITAMCRSVLRAHGANKVLPSKVLTRVNRVVCPDMREDMFISASYIVIDRKKKVIRLARAGHTPSVQYQKAQNRLITHEPKGMAIGIDEGDVFQRVIEDQQIEMAAGDCLLLYTDGVNEGCDAKGLEYGTERLHRVFLENASGGAAAALQAMRQDVKEFLGTHPPDDDMTLIVIEKQS